MALLRSVAGSRLHRLFRLPTGTPPFIFNWTMVSAQSPGRQLLLRGHEVVSHTASFSDGRHFCLVILLDPFDGRQHLKVFKEYAPGCDEAESRALARALRFLEARDVGATATLAVHSSIDIAGRRIDIFCDLIAEGLYQAFPFVRRVDGSRSLIMQFHLKEAVTGESPAAALDRCIHRLDDYFDGEGGQDS